MAKIIGIRNSEFKGSDGSLVKGVNIYLTEPIMKGDGLSSDHVFVTEDRLFQRRTARRGSVITATADAAAWKRHNCASGLS